jgi:hypothetical protein
MTNHRAISSFDAAGRCSDWGFHARSGATAAGAPAATSLFRHGCIDGPAHGAAMKGKEPAPRAMLLHNNHDGSLNRGGN